jgi:hypothetical protein
MKNLLLSIVAATVISQTRPAEAGTKAEQAAAPFDTPAALCAKVAEVRATCATDFLRSFPAAISDQPDPNRVTNIFMQAHTVAKRLASCLKDVERAQTKLRSFVELSKKANIRKEEHETLVANLGADLALLEREKTRLLDFQATLARFISTCEASWLGALNIGVQVWGPERALGALHKTLDQEYSKLKAEIYAMDQPPETKPAGRKQPPAASDGGQRRNHNPAQE